MVTESTGQGGPDQREAGPGVEPERLEQLFLADGVEGARVGGAPSVLTSRSMRPNASIARSVSAPQRLRCPWSRRHRRPRALLRAEAASVEATRSSSRPLMTTDAPSLARRKAQDRPMLGAAVDPVTMATWPENRCALFTEAASVRASVTPSADPMSSILSQDLNRLPCVSLGDRGFGRDTPPILGPHLSRRAETPGSTDAHQPAARHGGKARFDEETIMVSKTLASLDAWLALAEEVLAEQNVFRETEPGAGRTGRFRPALVLPRRGSTRLR